MSNSHNLGSMISGTAVSSRRVKVPFGKIASGTHLKLNIKNVAGSEARDIKNIGPYGVVSCPTPEMFAQIIFNDNVNNTCPGVWNDKAPEAKPGELILYSKDNVAQIKLDATGCITLACGASSIKLSPDGTINIVGTQINIG